MHGIRSSDSITAPMSKVEHSSHRRPKLLFFACYFPPAHAISSIRSRNIAKYLARNGWQVTVVTLDPDLWRNVEDPEGVSRELEKEGIRRINTGHRWRCLRPDHLNSWDSGLGWVFGGMCRRLSRFLCIDTGIGWIQEAERTCSNLTSQDVDVILATGDPFASFSIAKTLSHKLNRPYVLDYRDPWLSRYRRYGFRQYNKVSKLESDLVASASALTIVSPSLLNGRFADKVNVIPNGFDPEEMNAVKPYQFSSCAIVYCGTFYAPKIVITPLMKALRQLQDSHLGQSREWKFHYYGPQESHVIREANRYKIMDRVVLHGKVPRAEALSAMKGAAVSVVITSVIEGEKAMEDKCIITGKLFDALGLGVPVLVIGPTGSDVEGIIETSGLTPLMAASHIDGIVSFLKKVISGERPRASCPEAYAWPNLIKRLDVVLRNAISPLTPI